MKNILINYGKKLIDNGVIDGIIIDREALQNNMLDRFFGTPHYSLAYECFYDNESELIAILENYHMEKYYAA